MLAVVALLAIAPPSRAQSGSTAGRTATQALRDRDAEIRTALPRAGQSMSESERRRVEAIVARMVDTRRILESALGPRWATLTVEERQRLSGAFERRFKISSRSQLDSMRDARIEYLAERRDGSFVVVPTRVTAGRETSEVIYTMRQSESGWSIVDIVFGDVSTVENYRASFARVINREGVEGLIRRLDRGEDDER